MGIKFGHLVLNIYVSEIETLVDYNLAVYVCGRNFWQIFGGRLVDPPNHQFPAIRILSTLYNQAGVLLL